MSKIIKRVPPKERKRILIVRIEHLLDESPDTSFIGKYTDEPGPWVIVCQESEYLAILEQNAAHAAYDAYIKNDNNVENWKAEGHSLADWPPSFESWNESNGGDFYEIPSRGREFRFFEPEAGGEKPGTDDYQKYGKQDYDRMESLNRGSWCFIGIIAKATIQLTSNLTQEITSGGLWGIESDSGQEYFDEVEKEQLAELRRELESIGFTKKQIDAAFTNVERKEL